jgi:predicted metal-dependent peptidase
MEDYLGLFRLGPAFDGLAWLDCGSGADGAERGWDLGPDGADGLAPHERDAVRFRVAEGINGRPGDVPRGWQRWAEQAFHPPQQWRDLLGAAIRAAVSSGGSGQDYAFGRPARRSSALPGVVLPALRTRPPRVAVIIDTSGSVSDAELGSALVEVAAIGTAVGGRRDHVSVLSCDAAAGFAGSWCRAEGIPLIGGGGTDLRAGFTKALGARPRPDVVVVLTDGQTPWPAQQPPCRTVVGLFPRRAMDWDDRPPEWARVVTIGA